MTPADTDTADLRAWVDGLTESASTAAAPDLARHLSATLDQLEAMEAERERLRDLCGLAALDLLTGTPGDHVAGMLRRLSDPAKDANAHKEDTHDRS